MSSRFKWGILIVKVGKKGGKGWERQEICLKSDKREVIIDRLKLISYDHGSSKQELYYAFSAYFQKEKKGKGKIQWGLISDR